MSEADQRRHGELCRLRRGETDAEFQSRIRDMAASKRGHSEPNGPGDVQGRRFGVFERPGLPTLRQFFTLG